MFPLGLAGSPQDINTVVSLGEFRVKSDTSLDSKIIIKLYNCLEIYNILRSSVINDNTAVSIVIN